MNTANITGSPGTTWAGIGALAAAASQTIATNGLPTSTAGWITFGLSIVGGLGAILGRG